jgi:hypothetical protein
MATGNESQVRLPLHGPTLIHANDELVFFISAYAQHKHSKTLAFICVH